MLKVYAAIERKVAIEGIQRTGRVIDGQLHRHAARKVRKHGPVTYIKVDPQQDWQPIGAPSLRTALILNK